MFEFVGKQAARGFVKKLPEIVGQIYNGLSEGVKKTPIIRLAPYALGYWDTLTEEEKQKNTAIIIKAVMKALESYGNS